MEDSLLASMCERVRTRYLELGKQFGCGDTLEQARTTLTAFERHRDSVKLHGFIQQDADRLQLAHDLLTQLSSDGPITKRTSRGYVDAVREGKAVRQRGRAILYIVARCLRTTGEELDEEASKAVLETLRQTESSRGDPNELANQLGKLHAALGIPRVAREAQPRGGIQVLGLLKSAADRLLGSPELEGPPSGPSSREADVLCGVIVELVRDARRAARSAARETNDPTTASAFALTKLYDSEGHG